MTPIAQEECVPCREGGEALNEEEIKQLWLETPMWEVTDEDGVKHLHRTFELESYGDGLDLAMKIGAAANTADHHPTITIDYKKIDVDWTTHSVKGLHRNDFIMAAKSDKTYLDLMEASRAKGPVREASEESFPASDAPGWIGKTQETEHPEANTATSS